MPDTFIFSRNSNQSEWHPVLLDEETILQGHLIHEEVRRSPTIDLGE